MSKRPVVGSPYWLRGSSWWRGRGQLALLFLVGAGWPWLLLGVNSKSEVKRVEALPNFNSEQILVPKVTIQVGQKLTSDLFELTAFPQHLLPRNALYSLDSELLFATASLPVGVPVSRDSLSKDPAKAVNPMLARIPRGMRAMTVRVDATSAVEGWAGSGSIVDVLLVEKEQTILITESVQILSAERSLEPVDDKGSPSIPNTVTLLVSPEQCLSISTAIPRGRLSLVLRGASDTEPWERRSLQASKLMPGSTAESRKVSGVLVSEGQQFALVDGKWIHSISIPEGFLFAGQEKNEDFTQ
jgi:Flp pilus assembly protein CpaB